MDATRFDQLTRTISRVVTRRRVGRVLGSAVLALGLGPSNQRAVARVCRSVGERCGKGVKGRCCPGASCRKGRKGRGRCVCRDGLTACGGHCFEGPNDPRGCGPKCTVCPEDTDCCNGACCPAGQRCCGGVCKDLTADNANCGGCTQECPAELTCCDSRCRDLPIDTRHCGRCNTPCPTGETCVNGQCACRAPNANCGDGVCRDLQRDAANCGACGARCGLNQVCQGGQCTCRAGYRTCGPVFSTTCGLPDDALCERDEECCATAAGSCEVRGGVGRCQPCRGRGCGGPAYDFQCCGGLTCEAVHPDRTYHCGGCVGRWGYCDNDGDCCVTECTGGGGDIKECLSSAGGPCVANDDCRTCFRGGNCVNACVDGRCRV
jgi:hypothetical protein